MKKQNKIIILIVTLFFSYNCYLLITTERLIKEAKQNQIELIKQDSIIKRDSIINQYIYNRLNNNNK